MLRSLLTAHRQFIASSVEQLDTHTYLLTQADSGASAMSTYAGAVKALLTERDATVEALKTAVRAAAAKSAAKSLRRPPLHLRGHHPS